MTLKERLKKWALSFAEEGVAETVTEIAIDQLPPARILALITYTALFLSLLFGVAGWYLDSYEILYFVGSFFCGSLAVLAYCLRLYVVSVLSAILLKGYRYAKEQAVKRQNSPPNENQKTLPKEDGSSQRNNHSES